jgi:mRNA interferase RelE/StbE
MVTMPYRIELTKSAAKEIKKLQRPEQQKLIDILGSMQENPRPHGVEKLEDVPSFWRLCVGRAYRMVYTIDDKQRLVVIALVRNRKDAYRGLGNLNADKLIPILGR